MNVYFCVLRVCVILFSIFDRFASHRICRFSFFCFGSAVLRSRLRCWPLYNSSSRTQVFIAMNSWIHHMMVWSSQSVFFSFFVLIFPMAAAWCVLLAFLSAINLTWCYHLNMRLLCLLSSPSQPPSSRASSRRDNSNSNNSNRSSVLDMATSLLLSDR